MRGWFGRYWTMAPIHARDPAVVALLRTPDDGVQLDLVNEKLVAWTTITGASDTYLLDATGRAIAASNWAEEISFVGQDYSFRPYYHQAVQGRLGRFFALGTPSGKRGYYFSHPVRDDRRIIGVMVVKVGVDEIEQYLRTSRHQVFVTDPAGVIVLAGHLDWRLKTLGPVPEAERARIAAVRQYDLKALAPAAITVTDAGPVPGAAELVTARPDRSDARPREFLHLTAPMVAEDWTMHLLVSTAPARAAARATAALSASLLLAAGLGVALVRQRRRRLIERLTERERTQALLGRKIAERTAELSRANLRLRAEIGERIAAEEELRRTQADLVQAGKLAALGQMSAALSHEFNQSLTAIRTYAENALAFLERGRHERAAGNIARISTLTQRMAQLSRRLSSFARKPGADAGPVPLAEVLDETLGLLGGRLERAGIAPEVFLPEGGVMVFGGSVRLQHVFMNLIGNAIDALAGRPDPRIAIRAATEGDSVSVDVEDNGPGIAETDLPRIFDLPFLFADIDAVDAFQASEHGQALLTSMRKRGILGLAYWHNGTKQIWANRPPLLPADARGLKFRVQQSDVLVAQMAALGANPQKMAFSEVYGALQQGVVDGQENTWSNIWGQKFFEVQDGVTETNHGVIDYLVVTSVEFWEGLPDAVREQLAGISTRSASSATPPRPP